MKKPNINDLTLDQVETDRIRTATKSSSNIKITINIDKNTLLRIKNLASKNDIPYQRLLNRLLKKGLTDSDKESSRIDKLEIQLEEIKKKLAA